MKKRILKIMAVFALFLSTATTALAAQNGMVSVDANTVVTVGQEFDVFVYYSNSVTSTFQVTLSATGGIQVVGDAIKVDESGTKGATFKFRAKATAVGTGNVRADMVYMPLEEGLEEFTKASSLNIRVAEVEKPVEPAKPVEEDKKPVTPTPPTETKPIEPKPEAPQVPVEEPKPSRLLSWIDIYKEDGTKVDTIMIDEGKFVYEKELNHDTDGYKFIIGTIDDSNIKNEILENGFEFKTAGIREYHQEIKLEYKGVTEIYDINFTIPFKEIEKKYNGQSWFITELNELIPTKTAEAAPATPIVAADVKLSDYLITSNDETGSVLNYRGKMLQLLTSKETGLSSWFIVNDKGELVDKVIPVSKNNTNDTFFVYDLNKTEAEQTISGVLPERVDTHLYTSHFNPESVSNAKTGDLTMDFNHYEWSVDGKRIVKVVSIEDDKTILMEIADNNMLRDTVLEFDTEENSGINLGLIGAGAAALMVVIGLIVLLKNKKQSKGSDEKDYRVMVDPDIQQDDTEFTVISNPVGYIDREENYSEQRDIEESKYINEIDETTSESIEIIGVKKAENKEVSQETKVFEVIKDDVPTVIHHEEELVAPDPVQAEIEAEKYLEDIEKNGIRSRVQKNHPEVVNKVENTIHEDDSDEETIDVAKDDLLQEDEDGDFGSYSGYQSSEEDAPKAKLFDFDGGK